MSKKSGRAKGKQRARRAPAVGGGAWPVGQRVKVSKAGNCFNGYEGTVRGVDDAGLVVVQLDCKAVTHLFFPAALAAV